MVLNSFKKLLIGRFSFYIETWSRVYCLHNIFLSVVKNYGIVYRWGIAAIFYCNFVILTDGD